MGRRRFTWYADLGKSKVSSPSDLMLTARQISEPGASNADKSDVPQGPESSITQYRRKRNKEMLPLWRIIGSVSAYVAVNMTVRLPCAAKLDSQVPSLSDSWAVITD